MSEVDDVAIIAEGDESPNKIEEIQKEEKKEEEEEEEEEEEKEEEEEEEVNEECNSPEINVAAAIAENRSESPDRKDRTTEVAKEENVKEEKEEDHTEDRDATKEEKKEKEPSKEEEIKEESSEESARSFDAMTIGPAGEEAKGDESTPAPTGKHPKEVETKGEEGRAVNSPASTSSAAVNTSNMAGRENRAAVGEWNSLAVLVERLRSVLELSLAMAGTRLDGEEENSVKQDEAAANSAARQPEENRQQQQQQQQKRRSMELQQPQLALLSREKEGDLNKDLKFLEDLLMSDIHTALSRLRETLERIDVAALARHGAASDTSSKLHLLQLVSSLLSRLEVPEEERAEVSRPRDHEVSAASTEQLEQKQQPQQQHQQQGKSGRRHRGSRHTIGVSSEELARARKWLEEERNFKETSSAPTKIERPGAFECSDSTGSPLAEKRPDEIHDKNTKDAINHRQSLRDKSMDAGKSAEIRSHLGSVPFDKEETAQQSDEAMLHPVKRFGMEYERKLDCQRKAENAQQGNNVNQIYEHVETGRVGRLAAALQQRAESMSNENSKCSSNRFAAKRSKIKRANTIDIPSYLKLQAESMKNEANGCVSLRRPINVGDRTSSNVNNVVVPSFQPKTENDRKFMALISKNADAPSANVAPTFRTFGFVKTTDLSSVTNENWNSRFSNIKTTFDKAMNGNDESETQSSVKSKLTRRPPAVPQVVQRYNPVRENVYNGIADGNTANSTSPGFRHAPSSPFRRIERSTGATASKGTSPFACNLGKNAAPPIPGSTLREKARLMFDRGNQQLQKCSETKIESDNVDDKRMFPRPAWMEQDARTSSGNAISENGRLDYRSFCKQFAPFVRKGSNSYEEQRDPMRSCRPHNSEIVDGRISFNVISSKARENFASPREEEARTERRCEKTATTVKPEFAEATLRGYASVAVQTGAHENTLDEARSFRVAPRIANCPPLSCNSVSIQTSSDFVGTGANMERQKQANVPAIYDENGLVDRLQELQVNALKESFLVSNSALQPLANEQVQREVYSPFVDPNIGRTEGDQVEEEEEKEASRMIYDQPSQWCHEDDFLDARNIENQDISEEDGVITRYTCAIATVATIESPESSPMISMGEADSRESSTPSVSPSWCWSKARPTNDVAAKEDEIRRHNMLQQSLIQRLQHERCSMNANYVKNKEEHLQTEAKTPEAAPSSASASSLSTSGGQSKAASGNHLRSNKFLSAEVPRVTQNVSPVATCKVVNQVSALREVYEQPKASPMRKERSPIPNGTNPVDSSDEYLMSCANQPSRSIVLSKSESWHQLALSGSGSRLARLSQGSCPKQSTSPKPPKPRSPSSKMRTKQYEASSDSVKKMEDKIRRYFDSPAESPSPNADSKRRLSPRAGAKYMIGLSRSRTMPGICEQKITLTIPPPQIPLLQVNSADLDKVFDDIFQEATRNDDRPQQQHC